MTDIDQLMQSVCLNGLAQAHSVGNKMLKRPIGFVKALSHNGAIQSDSSSVSSMCKQQLQCATVTQCHQAGILHSDAGQAAGFEPKCGM
jgi:hypothetical protein